MNDLGALCIAFAVALLWLRLCDALAAQGVLEVKLSRKIIHIGTGPLFIATWPLFSEASSARYMAALVPLSICLQFAAVGLGFLKDPEAVAAMTRTGNPREILGGPLLYGLVHTAITASFWRESVAGAGTDLRTFSGGDMARLGFRGIATRAWLAVLLCSFSDTSSVYVCSAVAVMTMYSNTWTPSDMPRIYVLIRLFVVSTAATLVESLPFSDIDNVTVPVAGLLLSLAMF
eukprot:CAMPEP_0114319806 /NCGR_PEP_ID=MMETSP0059-20121206/25490_1 /TAXON_ID=36894 /ORGANISM="Pyramimonas parkeae, Strain CCMP726" /LENGTH=231 /DNA_ID=CAMNT_0001446943 /DNA_START=490 /DNA_END=1185 /DNA_ORIENTATION=-